MQKIISFLPGIAFALGGLAVDMSGYENPELAKVLIGIALLLLVFPAMYYAWPWLRERMRPMISAVLLGVAVGAAVGGVGGYLIWQQFWGAENNQAGPLEIVFDPNDLKYVETTAEIGLGHSEEHNIRRIRIAVKNTSEEKIDSFKIFVDELYDAAGRIVRSHAELRYSDRALPLWKDDGVSVEIAWLDMSDDQSKIMMLGGEYERQTYILNISIRMDDHPPKKKSYTLFIDEKDVLQMREADGSR